MTQPDPNRIADLEELYADEPEDPLAGFMLASEYAKAARPSDAARVFRGVVAVDPDYSAAWAGLANALEAQGLVAEARAAWTDAAASAARKSDKQVARQAEAALSLLR